MNHIFGDSTSISLPHNFAQSVLELQMEMEFQQSSTITVVQQLNQLYRIAIQHYINIEDQRKIQHFQRKLQTLLGHPRTLQAIENKNVASNKTTKNSIEYTQILKNQMSKFNEESNMLVRSMMDGSEIKRQRTNRLVNENIQCQQEKLRKRLESRGKSRTNTKNIR